MSRAWLVLKVELDGGNDAFPEPGPLADKVREVLEGESIKWDDYPINGHAVIDVVQVDGEPTVDNEPRDAGRDPYGRPDPVKHPEYWTE